MATPRQNLQQVFALLFLYSSLNWPKWISFFCNVSEEHLLILKSSSSSWFSIQIDYYIPQGILPWEDYLGRQCKTNMGNWWVTTTGSTGGCLTCHAKKYLMTPAERASRCLERNQHVPESQGRVLSLKINENQELLNIRWRWTQKVTLQ